MPLPVGCIQFSLLVHMASILRRRVVIEETHHRAVRHERHDAVGLVPGKLEASDPDQHYDQCETQKAHSKTIKRGCGSHNVFAWLLPLLNAPHESVVRCSA